VGGGRGDLEACCAGAGLTGESFGGRVKRGIEGRGWRRWWELLPLLLLLPLGVAPRPVAAQQVRRPGVCGECHRNLEASRDRALGHAKGRALTCQSCHHLGFSNDPATIAARRDQVCKGCHAELKPTHREVTKAAPSCSGCHRIHDEKRLPDPVAAAAVSQRCASCHTTPHKLHAAVTKSAPLCTDCHAAHSDRPLREADAALSQKCAACHKDAHPSHTGAAAQKLASACTSCHGVDGLKLKTAAQTTAACTSCHKTVPAAHAGVPATAVAAGGIRKGAPSCTDCHDFGRDRVLPAAGASISERCGACHTEAMRQYRSGMHANGLATPVPNGDLPTCVSCHPTHTGHAATRQDVRMAATSRCIQCHSDARLARKYDFARTVGASYLKDYHGATLEFRAKHPAAPGQPAVLTCSDCHSAHAVARNEKAVLAAVCLRCHKEGDAKLAGAWLGHSPAGLGNRPIIWLTRLFYYVLIPFELIGLTLVILFHLIDQRRKGARPLRTHGMKRLRARLTGKPLPPEPTVTRFSRLERLEHFLSMSTFILLVITGLPQTRPDLSFAQGIIGVFGGIAATRLVHRITGTLFVLLLVTHVLRAIVRSLRTKRLPVMIPTRQDFPDTLQMMKHYVWGAPKPKTGKFDSSEKFEYWGLFLGGTLMSVTGLALIFPELFTRFVPGVLLATFRVMHGLEATFAVSVVALWHSYGVMLRPEVFPLDTTIFTGEMSVERLEEEHGLEYERLFPEAAQSEGDNPDELLVAD